MNYPSTAAISAVKGDTIDADLTVVGGAGHVGIPLVLAFAEAGLTVNVNDLNESVLATLAAGQLPFIEYGAAPLLAKALAEKRLVFTSGPDKISKRGPDKILIALSRACAAWLEMHRLYAIACGPRPRAVW